MPKITKLNAIDSLMLDKLKLSGLTLTDAQLLQMRAYGAEELEAMGHNKARAGFHIPYFTLEGEPSGFHRVRYLEDPPLNGFGFRDKKAQRYSQLPGTLNEVYLPPSVPWVEAAAAVSIPIYITEGELKAACACKHDFITMGLGGVFNFMAQKHGFKQLPIFDEFSWALRPVYIVFDSDAINNPMVKSAEALLARMLMRKGAKVFIVRLPQGEQKVGLDDYLVEHGADAFKELCARAQPYWLDDELHKINETACIIRYPTFVIEMATQNKFSERNFMLAYSGRILRRTTEDAKGNTKTVEKNAAAEWINWPGHNILNGISYEPGHPPIFEGQFNSWRGWGVQPKEGNIAPWHKLLGHIFGKDVTARRWFEQWLAYPLQHPGAKLFSATVLWSVAHGTGKSLIGYTMGRIYGKNFAKIKDKDLGSAFNQWAAERQFIMGEEISGTGDKRGLAEELKDMISGTIVTVNTKYVPEYDIRDCLNYLFTTNKPDAFYLNRQDRRYFIWRLPETPMPAAFYLHEYDPWYRSDEGAGALFHYLLNLDLTGFEPMGHAMMTDAKMSMIHQSGSDLGRWVADIAEDPDRELKDKFALWTLTDLLAVFDKDGTRHTTQKALSNELITAGINPAYKGQPVRFQDGTQRRLWIVRRREELADAPAMRVRTTWEDERKNTKQKGAKLR